MRRDSAHDVPGRVRARTMRRSNAGLQQLATRAKTRKQASKETSFARTQLACILVATTASVFSHLEMVL